jgi:hypothetical protein
MPFKPNYNQQRAERNRLKQAKKDAKLREREDAVAARRRADQEATAPGSDAPEAGAPGSGAPESGAPDADTSESGPPHAA